MSGGNGLARPPIHQEFAVDERPQTRFMRGTHDALVAVSEGHVGLGETGWVAEVFGAGTKPWDLPSLPSPVAVIPLPAANPP